MFVGHYGVTFAARRAAPGLPLWLLFLAVQLLDVAWSILVLLGIEKVRIVPGITATNPLDLYYMPWTHSLPAALLWSAAAAVALRAARADLPGRAALILAAAVFSHWVLDLVVHRPDLPLWGNSAKVGLGLWNRPVLASLLETGTLLAGMYLYFRGSNASRAPFLAFGAGMLAIQFYIFFGPPPASPEAIAWSALASYTLFAAAAGYLERRATSPGDPGGAAATLA